MAIDWSVLKTDAPERVANSFYAGQQELAKNALLATQIQHANSANELQQYQLGSARRDDAAKNALSLAYQESLDPATGKADPKKVIRRVVEMGAGHLAPDLVKKFADADKEEVQAETNREKLKQERSQTLGTQLLTIYATPTNEAFAQLVPRLNPNDPHTNALISHFASKSDLAERKKILEGYILGNKEARDGLLATLPKPVMADLGGTRQFVESNQIAGQVGSALGSAMGKTATPDALITDARVKLEGALNRGNALEIARARLELQALLGNQSAAVSTANTNAGLGPQDQITPPRVAAPTLAAPTALPAPAVPAPAAGQRAILQQEIAKETALLAQATDPKSIQLHRNNIEMLGKELAGQAGFVTAPQTDIPAFGDVRTGSGTTPIAVRQPAATAAPTDANLSARERAKGAKPLTEFQGKAQMFGTRAAEADKILAPLEDKTSQLEINIKRGAEGKVLGGVTGMAMNKFVLSEDQQKVEQAQRNFVNAVLRQESGAVISPQEFDNAIKQYFPQPGDGPQVRAQKRANRKSVIEGFTLEAGSAGSRIQNATRGGGGIKFLGFE